MIDGRIVIYLRLFLLYLSYPFLLSFTQRFVIKMPIMHRLACLRDDLIFFIYLFQRYKYKTDYTRVNEFGQCAEPTEEMLAEIRAQENALSSTPTDQPKRRGARDKKRD